MMTNTDMNPSLCGFQRLIRLLPVLFVAFLVLSTGCEEAVDPVLKTDEAFSLYGYLDPSSDIQAVRVFSIDGVLENTQGHPARCRDQDDQPE